MISALTQVLSMHTEAAESACFFIIVIIIFMGNVDI